MTFLSSPFHAIGVGNDTSQKHLGLNPTAKSTK